MPQALKSPKPATSSTEFYILHPWHTRPHKDGIEILAFVQASSSWETVALVPPTSGASAEALAAYITAVINQHQGKQDLLREAGDALQELINEGLNYSTEQTAEDIVSRIQRHVA